MGAGADALCRTGSGSPGESTAATATASETGTRASARSSSPSRSCPRARTSPTGFPQYCHTSRGHSATRRSVALPRASSRTGVPTTTSSCRRAAPRPAGTPPSTSRRSRTPQRPTDATSTRVGAGSDLPRKRAAFRNDGTRTTPSRAVKAPRNFLNAQRTNRGARSSNSVLLLSHRGAGGRAGLTTERSNHGANRHLHTERGRKSRATEHRHASRGDCSLSFTLAWPRWCAMF
jgi:hypothetical protein